jgi:hypothetical protein
LYAFLFNTVALQCCHRIIPPQKPNIRIALPRIAYQKMAQRVMANTLALGKGYPTNYKEYCRERILDTDALKVNLLNVPDAALMLNSSHLHMFLINLKDHTPNERFRWEFVTKNELLATHRVRRILGCYTNDLADFEQEYCNELEQVPREEFIKRLPTIPQTDAQTLLIEEAGKLANAILKLPK